MAAKKFKLTLNKGLMGCTKLQREAVRCLGLRHRHQSIEISDSPAIRGNILKVQHLISIEVLR